MGTPGVQAPTRLGRYELLARLATGGMGEIFLARLEGAAGFEKLFVVKRILPHLADDARFRQMLIAEARLASKLSHPNICQVYELGETDGQLYIVMEYMEGVTLLPLLRKRSREQGQLEFGFVGGILQQATDALHYAHELKDRSGEGLGIVHRDVTPSNIFLTEAGVAKVLDFGIAKVKDASVQTQTGAVKGKYAYMAPEQLRGSSLDCRADVFALGVVVYEMLALRRLFQRKTDYLTFRAVMEQPIPEIRRYRPDIPEALAVALATALERDPTRRYDSARQFGSAVLDALQPLGRIWTQGEISDFVRSEFAADIAKRSAQVHTAIGRLASGTRATMPLIAVDESTEAELDDDDDEFPAVDSTISEAPLEYRATRPPVDTKDFAGQSTQATPLPFGVESSVSGVSLQPLAPSIAGAPQPAAPRPPRGLLWPLLTIVMIGIAGGALFLVWKQMQQQQPPAVVNITSSTRDDRPAPDRSATPTDAATASADASATSPETGSAAGPAVITKRPAPPRKDPPRGNKAYSAAIQAKKPSVLQCAQTHGALPGQVKVALTVSPQGRAKNVTLQPASLDGTPVGTCIKNVVSGIAFPSAPSETQLSFTVSPT